MLVDGEGTAEIVAKIAMHPAFDSLGSGRGGTVVLAVITAANAIGGVDEQIRGASVDLGVQFLRRRSDS